MAILRRIALAAALGICAAMAPAQAQNLLEFPARPKPIAKPVRENAPMLVQATELQYDYVNKRVSAVGNVQIYHRGSTLEADRVIFDENTKRLHAEGNVRLTDAEGKIVYGEIMDLSDDLRDGFVDALRLDGTEQTRMAAARADRTGGNFTVLHSGVYTACEPCKDDPKKPPLWQIKGARIIHDQGEKMIYFENAQLEFFGQPVAYMPYFSIPDPTVKRKTGLLTVNYNFNSKYGTGILASYYWALAPNYDLTFSPLITTKQGPLLNLEWRHRLDNGYYMIRASGIRQLDKDQFKYDDGSPTPGHRDWRGVIDSTSKFALSDKWTWGWDVLLPSDSTYLRDYNLYTYQRTSNIFLTGYSEGINQLWLTGIGDRSFFDIRGIYYYGFSVSDVQRQLPVIHPVMDYNYTFNRPILDGELGYRMNLTSLSRETVSFDAITKAALNGNFCTPNADPARINQVNCLLRGIQGTYSRFSAEAQWRRTIVDSYGQMFTPFVKLRGDVASLSIDPVPGMSNYSIAPGDSAEYRVMPTVGVEYRYPFINVQSWGTQTLQPIAQIVVRPNEMRIGKLPNEDAQSLLFDESNLFKLDKFSGWDRIEGGTRANVGLQYTAQFNRAGSAGVIFGQSYQLFGTNSFAVGDVTNTGLGSGLDTSRSDYVARAYYQPNSTYSFTTRYRFDHDTMALRRFEAESRASYDRWQVSLLYGHYDAQPQLGILNSRDGIVASGSVKLAANWVATGAVLYDLKANKPSSLQLGLGYIDDCIILAVNYRTLYWYSPDPNVAGTPVHSVVLQIGLRTLGSKTFSQALGGTPP